MTGIRSFLVQRAFTDIVVIVDGVSPLPYQAFERRAIADVLR
jgi:hypothetical protein